ncbi:MAG: MarR family winged helix-turn-helix transcriptional regulator [Sphingomonadales bacterium]|nr:MarR family winged helix-turn-helix transcriptional regulator [Sphingomonadales bacterium]
MSLPASDALIGKEQVPVEHSKSTFLECLQLVERLHRRLLDVIKNRLDSKGWSDVNAVQALLIYNIADHEMTAGELKTRGYYLGSNVSYNLKKLVELGYVSHTRSEHDRRSVRIALTEKGIEVRNILDELYDDHLAEIVADQVIGAGELAVLRRGLRALERFWADNLRFAS